MKVLFVTIAWPSKGERNLYTDLMEEFAQKGHDVYIAATHNSGDASTELSIENGMNVLRVQTGQIRKVSHIKKLLALLPLGRKISKQIDVYFSGVKFDLILGPTPPITLSGFFKKMSKKHNAMFYLLLKDIWPHGSVDLGVFKKYSLPWLFFRFHEIRIYKAADYIGVMSPMSIDYLLGANKYLSSSKLEVCPNSIRPRMQVPAKDLEIRDKYNIPKDACVFIFSGNLGLGHGLHFLIDAIKELSEYEKAYFVLGGSGTHYKYLEQQFNDNELKNAMLYSWLPSEDFDRILSTSDVGLILLYKYRVPQFPSRILRYLEFKKPVLCAITEHTDMGTIVEDHHCGKSLLHGDTKSFVEQVKYLAENDKERLLMGENGHQLLLDQYQAKQGYDIIMSHFKA